MLTLAMPFLVERDAPNPNHRSTDKISMLELMGDEPTTS